MRSSVRQLKKRALAIARIEVSIFYGNYSTRQLNDIANGDEVELEKFIENGGSTIAQIQDRLLTKGQKKEQLEIEKKIKRKHKKISD